MKTGMKLRNRRNQRGVAMMLTILGFMLLGVVVFGMIAITIAHSRSTSLYQHSQSAFYLARLGVTDALDRIEDLYRLSDYSGGTDKPITKTTSVGTYTYEIWAPPGNDTNSYKTWRITCTATVNNVKRTLTAWADMESFAEFTYCSNKDADASSIIWWRSNDSITGPVHTNTFFCIDGNPKFSDRVTCSNTLDPGYNKATKKYTSNIYTITGELNGVAEKDITNPTRFFHRASKSYKDNRPVPLNKSPNFSFCGAVPEIPLPQSLQDLQDKADTKYTSDLTVTFEYGGVTKVDFTNASGEKKTDYLSAPSFTLHTTGRIFIKGGTVHGTISLVADKNIEIHEDIRYSNKYIDALGLMSVNGDIVVNHPLSRAKDFYIDAVLMAPKGSFRVDETIRKNLPSKDFLRIYGGITQAKRGGVGAFTMYGETGYKKDYRYDPKMTFFTPPNYPVTGNVRLFCVQDSAALGKN